MKKSTLCDVTSRCGGKLVEIIGMALILVATFLTIISLNGLGILAMFAVGLVLAAHKHCCSKKECAVEEKKETKTAKKTTKK